MNMTKMKAPTQRKARFDAGQVANRIVKELEPVIGSEIRMYAHYNWVFFHTGLNIYIPGEGIKVVIKPGMETPYANTISVWGMARKKIDQWKRTNNSSHASYPVRSIDTSPTAQERSRKQISSLFRTSPWIS
jgi:hypothetical protein